MKETMELEFLWRSILSHKMIFNEQQSAAKRFPETKYNKITSKMLRKLSRLADNFLNGEESAAHMNEF